MKSAVAEGELQLQFALSATPFAPCLSLSRFIVQMEEEGWKERGFLKIVFTLSLSQPGQGLKAFSNSPFLLSSFVRPPPSAMHTANSPPCIAYLVRGHVHMTSAVGGGTPKADVVREVT